MAKLHKAANPGMPSTARITPDAKFTGTYTPINPPAIFIRKRMKKANAKRNQNTDRRSMFFSIADLLIRSKIKETAPIKTSAKIFSENFLSFYYYR